MVAGEAEAGLYVGVETVRMRRRRERVVFPSMVLPGGGEMNRARAKMERTG